MFTKKLLDEQYKELACRLGDNLYKQRLLQDEEQQLREQMKQLNVLSEPLLAQEKRITNHIEGIVKQSYEAEKKGGART